MMDLTPKQIVSELDRYIIGQTKAKRAVAIALRNRYRRGRLPEAVRDEITPKNIIMKGPTGVGKTEIARRLAKIMRAPFIKVEATKYTEVGYVGRDVESMIRDLAETAVHLVKEEQMAVVESKARRFAEEKIIDAVVKARKKNNADIAESVIKAQVTDDLHDGKLNKMMIEIEVAERPPQLEAMPGMSIDINLNDMLGSLSNLMPQRKKRRKVTVEEAISLYMEEESERLLDMDAIKSEGVRRAQEDGIIFIDEIDKIANRQGASGGMDVSREGVQRDILPIVEGCTVMTKYGAIKTDYILFIAAGAFQISSVTDLIPELQGRFPIRVDLESLTFEDFVKIFTEPENAVTRQYAAMLSVENINLTFTPDAIEEMSRIAVLENETGEDIGARRLHTVMESLLEDISFNADGNNPVLDVKVDKAYVTEHLAKEISAHDLKKYIL
ncbi:MAG: ATP-dependent protease ATPase subunit HslU [Roseburia sp.]|nr:ATP-dependent protease ATPase subunit HslU [Roseburia sp.]